MQRKGCPCESSSQFSRYINLSFSPSHEHIWEEKNSLNVKKILQRPHTIQRIGKNLERSDIIWDPMPWFGYADALQMAGLMLEWNRKPVLPHHAHSVTRRLGSVAHHEIENRKSCNLTRGMWSRSEVFPWHTDSINRSTGPRLWRIWCLNYCACISHGSCSKGIITQCRASPTLRTLSSRDYICICTWEMRTENRGPTN